MTEPKKTHARTAENVFPLCGVVGRESIVTTDWSRVNCGSCRQKQHLVKEARPSSRRPRLVVAK